MTRFLTEADVLAMLQVSSRTLRGWVSGGRFPAPVRLEGEGRNARKRWDSDEVETWRQAKLSERQAPKEIVA